MVNQELGEIPGSKLAPFTTPVEVKLGRAGEADLTKGHTAPALLLSPNAPIRAVLPSPETATEEPCDTLLPAAPAPVSLPPCWLQTPLERVNTHAAPEALLSLKPPSMKVFPSPDTLTAAPCCTLPAAPVPTSLLPCGDHTPLERVNTHTAPASLLSPLPPAMAVFPSAERATELPCCWMVPTPPVPTSLLPCWVHTPLERVNTQTAPSLLLSPMPPAMAVFPSAERATEKACCWRAPAPPVPTSLPPCWIQAPLERVKTQAAPKPLLSLAPPTIAVLPSPDRATANPWLAAPAAFVPTSFPPCWLQTPLVRVNTHAAPAKPLSLGPPTMAVFPSAETLTDAPCNADPAAP